MRHAAHGRAPLHPRPFAFVRPVVADAAILVAEAA
jgi:hypothetical protein